MKAISWIIVVILALLAVIFGIMWMGSANKISDAEKKAADAQSMYENATNTLNEVQSSLESLDKDLLGTIEGSTEMAGATPEERRARLVGNISNMRTQIEADKKRIADLERQLSSSKGQLASIQSMVNKLKSSVTDKEKILAELERRLGDISQTLESERMLSQAEINKRESMIKEKQSVIEAQNIDNNRIYYVFGTRKELVASDVIDRKGGILGIGKVSTVSSPIVTDKYTEINLLDSQQISFPATKKGFAILSNHVASSYRVEKVGDKNVLTVTNPELFRKQKFLVIELL